MRRTRAALTLTSLCLSLAVSTSPAHAQTTPSQQGDLFCSTFPMNTSFGKRQLWDGYSVSVEPTATFKEGSMADDACTGTIYDSSGNEVYSTTGPGIMLDPSTGMDIDGDDAPDVVLLNGASGASGGDWTIEAVSLRPQPHLLFEFDISPTPPADFERDSRQRTILWTGDRVPVGYGFANADTPSVQRTYRFENGKLTEVTDEYFDQIEKSEMFPQVSQNEIEDFRTAKIGPEGFASFDDEETASRVLSLILQNIFCRRFDQALHLIHQAWPPDDQANLIDRLKVTFKHRDCSACSKGIEPWQ